MMPALREKSMLHFATRVIRAGAPSPATALTSVVLLAVALCCGAQSARAADIAPKPATDTTVQVTAFPPSVRVDSTVAQNKDEDADASDSPRRGSTRIHIDTKDDFPTDEFQATVEKMPWIIGLIFLVVGSIFLTPVVLVIGIVWYKLRKTRLQNEAMLALAEKGVVSPAQAADALAIGAPPSAVAPQVYHQAVALRKRVIWSDLRKGIIMTMLGLAFSFYSMTGEGNPNWVGLVLIFVGLGYIALWWLEGRHLERAGGTAGDGGAKPGGG
jgi:hypothetical protein